MFFSVIATITMKGDFFMNLKEKFKESAKELGNTRSIAVMAMLVAVCIVCEKFLVIPVGGMIKQVKFTIIPATIAGMLFGPVAGTIVVSAGDAIANMSFFTFQFFSSAVVTGLLCGLFFYRQKKISWIRVILAITTITVVVYAAMNTYWVATLYGLKKEGAVLMRMISIAIQYPIDVVCVYCVLRALRKIPLLHPYLYGTQTER